MIGDLVPTSKRLERPLTKMTGEGILVVANSQ
jgi:hypothetical protein